MRVVQMLGQLNFADLIANFSAMEKTMFGERITSLKRFIKHRSYLEVEERLHQRRIDASANLGDILKETSRVIKPLLKSMGDNPMESEEYQILKQMVGVDFKLFHKEQFGDVFRSEKRESGPDYSYLGVFNPNGVSRYDLSRKRTHNKDEKVLYLWCPEVFQEKILVGFKFGTPKYKNGFFERSTHLKTTDISYAISWMIMLSVVKKNFFSEDVRKTVRFGEIEADCNYFLFRQRFTGEEKRFEKVFTPRDVIFYSTGGGKSAVLLKEALEKRGHHVCLLSDTDEEEFVGSSLYAYLQGVLNGSTLDNLVQFSIKFQGVPPALSLFKRLRELLRKQPGTDLPLLVTDSIVCAYLMHDCATEVFDEHDAEALVLKAAEHSPTLSETTSLPRFYEVASVGSAVDVVILMYLLCSAVMEHEIRAIQEERKEISEHAKSFQTKKNIPQKVQDFMNVSVLKNFFTFVEYDEDTDLAKAAVVEEQILEFVTRYFSEQHDLLKAVKLRFRRLGNHKAAGLYYPTFETICIDIRYPNSFIHEFGHCLDYHYDELSNCLNSKDFRSIYSRYEYLLRKKLSDEQLKLTGKYDLNYFLKETEVFARCFELFFAYCVGLDNSLLKTKAEYEAAMEYHPENKDFMEMVSDYFTKQFNIEVLETQRKLSA